MVRLLLAIAIAGWLVCPARADIRGYPLPLHHALYPQHDQKLVVAGKIVEITNDREFRFLVADVILGDESVAGQTLPIANNIVWPESHAPLQKGTACILLLDRARGRARDKHHVVTVVSGRLRGYPLAADTLDARSVLSEELLAQLKSEKSAKRQRALLRQVAPILAKEKSEAVEGFLTSDDPWVRRAAIAALVYATEEPKFLEMAAKDVQEYFKQFPGEEVEGPDSGVRTRPDVFLFGYYFFLVRRSWTWGSMWNEKEAEKHLRIVDGMLKFKILDEGTQKRLLGK
ncbi:MAG: hypothetical protein L0211_00985 [Planctomycetaceae bacterium]|nr:hypothetical protein [Planctomycetaceae bacterium]